ncbi:lanthionine synthetase LanC family protein [Chryseobacterium luteum]|uniref:Lanthionine synthetase C family protein n=1 Tax=Chryseobacterium luteum TaxID=421531 RepID=A0A085ZY83_9FLAO|nr:lanthionine synthetase LanC family protein [Chryseobacterium luteum]KFF09397.1 hypothetical protein IX38_02545 [Chryseobacterium luteum]
MMVIDEILKYIAESIIQTHNKNNNGLLSGLTGETIFLLEYSKINPDYEKYVEDFIDEINDSIEKGIIYHSHCAGMPGIVSGLDYIYRGYYEEDYDAAFDFLSDDIEEYISSQLDECLTTKNIDFLHGAIGIGFYYIKRFENGNLSAKDKITSILNYLEENAIVEDSIVKWYMNHNSTGFNISISHGISSIVIFLSKIISLQTTFGNDVPFLLEGAVNYILSQEIDKNKYGSYFPYASIEEKEEFSRLAWCYGDLGIGLALLNASEALKKEEWHKKALEIFDFSTTRKDPAENIVLDAPICHGSSGIALIFFIVYQQTKQKKYLDAAQYWETKTLELMQKQDPMINCFYDAKKGEFTSNLSLLEGLAGVGLVFLKMNSDNNAVWHEFLLV